MARIITCKWCPTPHMAPILSPSNFIDDGFQHIFDEIPIINNNEIFIRKVVVRSEEKRLEIIIF